jgi:hypothetical protein
MHVRYGSCVPKSRSGFLPVGQISDHANGPRGTQFVRSRETLRRYWLHMRVVIVPLHCCSPCLLLYSQNCLHPARERKDRYDHWCIIVHAVLLSGPIRVCLSHSDIVSWRKHFAYCFTCVAVGRVHHTGLYSWPDKTN